MAVYRGKYILQGLEEITPEMEHNLDIAYEICMSYRDIPCETCGKCCHQPNIIVLPEETERVATAAGIPHDRFMEENLRLTDDGRFLIVKKERGACPFLSKDKRCTIWKDRPQICDDFPYMVSLFMSRVDLALTNPGEDVLKLVQYMDRSWPCTKVIQKTIRKKVEERRKDVILN